MDAPFIIPEYEMDASLERSIHDLLKKCFPGYPNDKTYYKQTPSFRVLSQEDKQVIGHVAVDFRRINQAGKLATIFGLSDVCVDPAFRGLKWSARLITFIEALALKKQVDFLILIAADISFYEGLGFEEVDNPHRWLIIQNDQSLGLAQRPLSPGLMIKSLNGQVWEPGPVDLLGAIF